MNDLMTKSFLSYVDLKKQAMKDIEAEPDLEMGKLEPAEEQNLTKFFEQVNTIKADMEEITNLLLDLQDLNEETKSTHSAKVLRGLRDRINADMVSILRKAKDIKARLESFDQSNIANRDVGGYKEGSPVDRMRMSVTSGLRVKLREMMDDFLELREQIVKEHKEGLKRRYYNATGEEATEEVIDKILRSGEVKVFEGKTELVMENQERGQALKDLKRSLTELHQVFLDMVVLVEAQGEQIHDIEKNVADAGIYISGGNKELLHAKQLRKKRERWVCWIMAFVLLVLLVCFISIIAS